MIAKEDCIISRTKNHLQIFEFLVNCLDHIQLKTGITPNQTGNCGKSDEDITTKASKRGRPKGKLRNRMLNDPDGAKWEKLHLAMKGKKGKNAALIILACIEMGWMNKPTHKEVKEEFDDIGTQQGFTGYLDRKRFEEKEIEGVKEALRNS